MCLFFNDRANVGLGRSLQRLDAVMHYLEYCSGEPVFQFFGTLFMNGIRKCSLWYLRVGL
jgi:hypothetical protein